MKRWITPDDYKTLQESLKKDQYHQKTTPEFFYFPGSFTTVYEDELGPILFLRGVKSLRLDIQFLDNRNFDRNRKTMLEEFPKFVENCRSTGFKEIVFNTSSPLLKRFCKQKLKFEDIEGDDLRYQIKDQLGTESISISGESISETKES